MVDTLLVDICSIAHRAHSVGLTTKMERFEQLLVLNVLLLYLNWCGSSKQTDTG